VIITEGQYTWSSDLHVLLTPGIGFLVVFRCTAAFNRFWEARGHISKAVKGCRTLSIIVITQYHRHAGKPGDDIPKAVDDVRRYLLVYFHTMINQLHEMDVRQPNIEDFVTKQEMDLLLRRRTGQAITALKWIGARLAYLESLGYLSPLQLHETNESVTMLIEAFNGLTKIKSTPIPFPIRQLCSLLTVIYVYTAPLALATAFRNYEQWNNMGRTIGGALLLAIAFFGINQTAADLEDPMGVDSNDLPLDRMGKALVEELNGLFSEPIPILKSPNERSEKAMTAA
jgi:putative membrane protein